MSFADVNIYSFTLLLPKVAKVKHYTCTCWQSHRRWQMFLSFSWKSIGLPAVWSTKTWGFLVLSCCCFPWLCWLRRLGFFFSLSFSLSISFSLSFSVSVFLCLSLSVFVFLSVSLKFRVEVIYDALQKRFYYCHPLVTYKGLDVRPFYLTCTRVLEKKIIRDGALSLFISLCLSVFVCPFYIFF